MQKKLIALAVASLASGAALAQTNVTIYGIADAGYVYASGDDYVPGSNTFSGIRSGLLSGSRIGFKGEEALGNGLKAIFTLEYSLEIDNNTGIGSTGGLNARQQFVGLSSDKLGTAALGRQYAPGYLATVNNDPFGGAAFESQSFLSAQAGNTITPNSGARLNNAITYTSPNWSGFTAKAIYAFGERGDGFGGYNDKLTSVSDNGFWGLGGNYANGPLNIDLVYQSRVNKYGTAGGVEGNGNNVNEWYVGGFYDFKVVKVMASYQNQDDKNFLDLDNSIWTIGAVAPFGATALRFGYAQLDWDRNNNFVLNNGKTQSVTLGVTHDLSKRTTLYAGYVWTDNDRNSFSVVNTNGSFSPVDGVGAIGQSNNTFLAGLRHSF